MSITDKHPSSHNSLPISDPHGLYDFSFEIDASTSKNIITASRTYSRPQEIEAIWPTKINVINLINSYLSTDASASPSHMKSPSQAVTIDISFTETQTGNWQPTEIAINGTPLSNHDIAPGFWSLNDYLVYLIETNLAQLTHTTIAWG